MSEEYDECFDLELTNTFTANELICNQQSNNHIQSSQSQSKTKPNQSSNRSINSASTHANSTNHRVNKQHDLSSIPTEIELEVDENKDFEFNKTNDDIDKSSLISCTSKDTKDKNFNRFNNESVNVYPIDGQHSHRDDMSHRDELDELNDD